MNRFVVSQDVLQCLMLLSVCWGKQTRLYAITTDDIYFKSGARTFKDKADFKFSAKKIRSAYTTSTTKLCYFEKHY